MFLTMVVFIVFVVGCVLFVYVLFVVVLLFVVFGPTPSDTGSRNGRVAVNPTPGLR